MTLTEFLLARFTEDQRRAEAIAATIGTGGHFASIVKDHADLAMGDCPSFVAEYDPARALAECEAKRRIVTAHADRDDLVSRWYLGVLALPYADHPDYREEWKP